MSVEAIADGWRVTPPTRRFDLAIEEDLIEEIARIHGYDAIPTTLPGGATRLAAPSEARVDEATVRRQLATRDYLEAINYAFVDTDLLAKWSATDAAVPLANPLSAELGVMRTQLLPGLVSALARNAARQQPRVRLFELGKTFAAERQRDAPIETMRVAAVACGDAARSNGASPRARSISTTSRAISTASPRCPARSSNIGRRSGLGPSRAARPTSSARRRRGEARLDRPAASAPAAPAGPRCRRGRVRARSGAVARACHCPKATGLSKYPSVRRDLAFVVAESVPWAAVSASVQAAAGASLRDLVLFDRYAGKGVETGFKSLAMGLILQDESRTLTDRDVEAVVAEVMAALQQDHGAVIRS